MLITALITRVSITECRNTVLAPFSSPLPILIAVIVVPPIMKSMLSAFSIIMNGYVKLIAPSASVPTPAPTNIPSITVNKKKLTILSTDGATNLISFFVLLLIIKRSIFSEFQIF